MKTQAMGEQWVQCDGPEHHWYDRGQHSDCPHCGVRIDPAGATWGAPGPSPSPGPSPGPAGQPGGTRPMGAGGGREVRPTVAGPHPGARPAAPTGDKPTVRAPVIGEPGNMGSEELRPAPPRPAGPRTDVQPVVGWLVCIAGPDQGRDFRIHAARNHIGRGPDMDIVIAGDEQVNRQHHAVVSYEPKRHTFSLAPGTGSGLTYLNDDELLTPRPLAAYDLIEVGATRLLFIPLCGPRFNWQDGPRPPADPNPPATPTA